MKRIILPLTLIIFRCSNLFLINLNPVLFEDSFIPDVDAVYATYKDEIVCELSTQFSLEQNSAEINEYEKQHHLIFLSFTLK